MRKIISTNPSKNYAVLGEVDISTEDEIRNKVLDAGKAFQEWKLLGLEQRVKILRVFVQNLDKTREKLAILGSQEMGMPIRQSKDDVASALNYFNWYLDNAEKYLSPEITYEDESSIHTAFREPVGVVAAISPWNYPLSNFVWTCGQNLIVGNVVIYKTSEECPLFGKLIEEMAGQSNLPHGVFSEVYGDGEIGSLLVNQNIDLVCFTGSSKVGRDLYKIGGEKFMKVVLELGGSAPGIVFEDADIDNVVETIYANRFSNCGQMCDALKRLIVHESRFDELVQKLKSIVSSQVVGDAADIKTDIGPLVAKRQLELLESQVADAVENGAKVIIGGKRPEKLQGAYFLPTILTNIKPSMRVWQEEVFGPVLPIVRFTSENEANRLANDTKYGLGSYIYTKDNKKAVRVAGAIETNMVSVNNASYVMPCNPFGGTKASGFGSEHGKYGFQELTKVKIVSMEK